MHTVSMKLSFAAGNATLSTTQSPCLNACDIPSMKLGVGCGMDTNVLTDMAALGCGVFRKLRIGRFIRNLSEKYRQERCLITNAEIERASIQIICGRLRLDKTTILERSCAEFLLGGAWKTRRLDEAAYAQPDLFIEPPKPKPEQLSLLEGTP